MASVRKRRVSGKFCVAGGPGMVSCCNTSLTPGISMHVFPSDEGIRKKWSRFIQKHRPAFKPSKTSVICSIHFRQDCFSRRLDLLGEDGKNAAEISMCRRLIKGSIPTIDTAVEKPCTPDLTTRAKRRVSRSLIDIL